jgi:4-hydroxy-3-methylbut-2-enyl diphosphate reductase
MGMTMTKTNLKEIHLAATQGFCAGVASAIEVVDRALEKYGTPLYVRHHIVHNTTVIDEFEAKGVIFIEELEDVPSNNTVIFSAHGTAPQEYEKAKERGLKVIDATCPLVTKIHREAVRFSSRGVQTVLIGHRGHQELIGTSGYVDPENLHIVEEEDDVEGLELDRSRPIGYLTQTTLSVDDTQRIIKRLRAKYPEILGPPKADICYATTNRQNSAKDLTGFCDVIIVCGSPTSSNSNRLRECAADEGVDSYIIDTVDELDMSWLEGKTKLGITSGASVPQKVVDDVVEVISKVYPDAKVFQEESLEKGIKFPIPNV